MKQIGIWIDKQKAHIVDLTNKQNPFKTIASNLDDYHVKGGSGTRLKGGPQDVVHDSKYLERKKQQLKNYFKTIVSEIKDADELVIFGPAETNFKFKKELQEHHKELFCKTSEVQKKDNMTDNQIVALVRDYYSKQRY
jgi:hypothetical protein